MGGGASLVLPSPCPTTRMITASLFPPAQTLGQVCGGRKRTKIRTIRVADKNPHRNPNKSLFASQLGRRVA